MTDEERIEFRENIRKAISEGYMAYEHNISIDKNPYTSQCFNECWIDGWLKASKIPRIKE